MDYDSHMGQPKILRLTTCLLPGGPQVPQHNADTVPLSLHLQSPVSECFMIVNQVLVKQ